MGITSSRQPPSNFCFTLTHSSPQHPGQPALPSGCQPEAGNSAAAASLRTLKYPAHSTCPRLRADWDQSRASQLLFLSFSFPSFHLTQTGRTQHQAGTQLLPTLCSKPGFMSHEQQEQEENFPFPCKAANTWRNTARHCSDQP